MRTRVTDSRDGEVSLASGEAYTAAYRALATESARQASCGNDDVEAVLSAAGLSYAGAHAPHIAAVVYDLTRARIDGEDWYARPECPREAGIQLSEPREGDDELYLSWREDCGWFTVPYHDDLDALDDNPSEDLPVGRLAEPHEVARAGRELIGGPVSSAEPMWRAPADYDPAAAPATAGQRRDASTPFAAALATYTTHPTWTLSHAASSATATQPITWSRSGQERVRRPPTCGCASCATPKTS